MKNTILLVAVACLLSGCAGEKQSLMKLNTEVTSERGLPVRVMSYDEQPLPVKMIVSDEIVIGAFIASLIAVVATCFAAIAAWRTAYSVRKALGKIKNKIDE
jgi:hypothetical protein